VFDHLANEGLHERLLLKLKAYGIAIGKCVAVDQILSLREETGCASDQWYKISY